MFMKQHILFFSCCKHVKKGLNIVVLNKKTLTLHNIVMCMNQSDSIVIIPTYNEKENVENIIRAVFALEKCFHILIIDDESPDGTASIVKRLQSEEFADRLFLIERQGKLGLGTAYITGFKWALENNYEYVFEMDADFQSRSFRPSTTIQCMRTRRL